MKPEQFLFAELLVCRFKYASHALTISMQDADQKLANLMSSQLRLNLVEGSVSFNFTPDAAKSLQSAIATLMTSLKTTAQQAAGKATPQKPMEYQFTGEVFLEIFCNPNIWPSPFAAKVLVTVRDERIRLTTEAELTRLMEDLNLYLDQA